MKKINKIILSFLGFFLGLFSLSAQIIEAPEWKFTVSPSEAATESVLSISFEAEIPQGWYMYSSDFSEDVGPRPQLPKQKVWKLRRPLFKILFFPVGFCRIGG